MSETPTPAQYRKMLALTLSSAAAAALFIFAGILPAEFNRDPTGLGKLTGIDRLWAPTENVLPTNGKSGAARPAQTSEKLPFRSEAVDIRLAASTKDSAGKEDVEYKVHLEKGASVVYSWDVSDIEEPEDFYTEFHGHTVIANKAMTVAYYRKATGSSDNGTLTAPFAGVHGWYYQNQSIKPVTVRLRLSGFYTLIPDGQPGATGSAAYWGVPDAAAELARLLELGAELRDDVQEVGEGIKVAAVLDPFGNVFGIIENPHFDKGKVG